MKNDQTKMIAVLGMHRSGTSMMGGILNGLGLSPGSTEGLLIPSKYNKKGYFENYEVMRCNEQILSGQVNRTIPGIHESDSFINKATLDGLGWIYGAWVNQADIEEGDEEYSDSIKRTLRNFFEKETQQKAHFIKDPRMSLTLNQWSKQTTFDAAVVMVRNPESVAKSLLYRNQIVDHIGYDLWQLYTCNALMNVQQIPHLIVDYDTFLSDKRQTLDSLLSLLRNTIAFTPSDKTTENALLTIEQGLNHKNKYPSVNKPPENIISLYDNIISGKINGIENEFKHWFAKTSNNWLSALYLAEKHKSIHYASKCKARIERLNRHVIVGKILALLRRIKKDQTFGSSADF